MTRATIAGTAAFASRFGGSFAEDFYRKAGGLSVSSIGMGTYLGDTTDDEDARYAATLAAGITSGLNLLDTAINYRCQRSEKAVGTAVRDAITSGDTTREELVICTKAGYVPLDGHPPGSRDEYKRWLEAEYLGPGIVSREDLVAGGHCLSPSFLSNQIGRSLSNLGLECIDVFYLHNPEQQLDVLGRGAFREVVTRAFAELESQVRAGRIGAYGCATWNGLRVFPASRNYLSLAELVDTARSVAGEGHHFRFIQLPVNLALTEAVRSPTQEIGGKHLPVLEAAQELGISVIASASLMQAQLVVNLPEPVKSLFPALQTDAQRSIAFVRSLPLASALVGMKQIRHLHENLVAGRQ